LFFFALFIDKIYVLVFNVSALFTGSMAGRKNDPANREIFLGNPSPSVFPFFQPSQSDLNFLTLNLYNISCSLGLIFGRRGDNVLPFI